MREEAALRASAAAAMGEDERSDASKGATESEQVAGTEEQPSQAVLQEDVVQAGAADGCSSRQGEEEEAGHNGQPLFPNGMGTGVSAEGQLAADTKAEFGEKIFFSSLLRAVLFSPWLDFKG